MNEVRLSFKFSHNWQFIHLLQVSVLISFTLIYLHDIHADIFLSCKYQLSCLNLLLSFIGERSKNIAADCGEGDDTITLIKRRSKSNLKLDVFPSVTAAVEDIEAKSDKSTGSNHISLSRNGSCNTKELVQMVRTASLSRIIADRSNSADMSANSSIRKKADEEVIQVFRSYR